MKVIYNNKLVSENSLSFNTEHRGLSYGDGLFETIIANEGIIHYFDRHIDRLNKGMAALGMISDGNMSCEKLLEHIHNLFKLNNLLSSAVRIKIIVWRKSGGLFTPSDNRVDFIITVKEQKNHQQPAVEAELSEQVRLYASPYSRFKTCNMLPYILAGIEKKSRKISELVLLSYEEHIAECSSSNIFWVKDEVFSTPSLETGCIEGIMRGVIIDKLNKKGIVLKEVKEKPDALRTADTVFTSNVSGVKIFKRFEKHIYKNTSIASLIKVIF